MTVQGWGSLVQALAYNSLFSTACTQVEDCTGMAGHATHFDWSVCGRFLRANCGLGGLYSFTMPDGDPTSLEVVSAVLVTSLMKHQVVFHIPINPSSSHLLCNTMHQVCAVSGVESAHIT
jgi:hypothetical protein